MTIQTKLSDLDPKVIAQYEQLYASWLSETYPDLDLSEGRVFRETYIRNAAQLNALLGADIDIVRKSRSLKDIEDNPNLASSEIVDGILSNYRITRDPGSIATGQLNIVIDRQTPTVVAKDTVFTLGSLKFKTNRTIVGVTNKESVFDTRIHRLIVPIVEQVGQQSVTKYTFVIDVEAEDVGTVYQLRKGTVFPVNQIQPPISQCYQVFATSDFLGGRSFETNEQLISRFKQSLSPRALCGRVQIDSLIKDTFASTKFTSIIGYGDAEMLRDRNNIFKISNGGKADIYAVTRDFPSEVTLTKDGIYDPETEDVIINISRDDVPGFYAVTSIIRADSLTTESLEIVDVITGLNTTPDSDSANEFVPSIANMVEGGFSSYRTGIIKFKDSSYDSELTDQYKVTLLVLPGIKTLQDKCNNRSDRNPNADYLIKAPVPALCSISLDVYYVNEIPLVEDIKQAVMDAVNNVGFTIGKLPASLIYNSVHEVIGKNNGMLVSPIDMRCVILKPGGGVINLRSSNSLDLPNLPEEGVTSRTTVFYISESDIDVSISKSQPLQV